MTVIEDFVCRASMKYRRMGSFLQFRESDSDVMEQYIFDLLVGKLRCVQDEIVLPQIQPFFPGKGIVILSSFSVLLFYVVDGLFSESFLSRVFSRRFIRLSISACRNMLVCFS